jgi:hypothetical protein
LGIRRRTTLKAVFGTDLRPCRGVFVRLMGAPFVDALRVALIAAARAAACAASNVDSTGQRATAFSSATILPIVRLQ